MNQNKKKALIQCIFSLGMIIFCLLLNPIIILSKVVKWVLFIFFIILLIDGLRRLFKKEKEITPEEAGSFDRVFKENE